MKSESDSSSGIACATPLPTSAATARSATRREARHAAGEQRGALRRVEAPSGRRDRQQQRRHAADPDRHRAHVQEVGGHEQRARDRPWTRDRRDAGVRQRKAASASRGQAAGSSGAPEPAAGSAISAPKRAKATSRRPQTVPKRVPITSPSTSGSSAPQNGGRAGRGALEDDARAPSDATPDRGRGQPEGPRACGEGVARGVPGARPGAALSAGPQTAEHEGEPAGQERDGEVAERAHGAEGGLGDRAGAPASIRSATLDRAPPRRLPTVKVKPPRDRVRVGGDDAVGRGVDAVGEAVAQATATASPRPPGCSVEPLSTRSPLGVVDAHRAERHLDRLVEAQLDALGRAANLVAAAR